ncbi:thioredoxin family protein [bacterium]|nr:thioredoxin family protein [bacterium]
MKKTAWLMFTILLIFLLPLSAFAQDEPPVAIEVVTSASGFAVGSDGKIAVLFDVPADHHITDVSFGLWYVDFSLPDGISLPDTVYPKGEMENGEAVYRGEPAILFEINVAEDAPVGSHTVSYSYSYQICRELEPEMCFLPNGGEGEFTLEILEAGQAAIPSSHEIFADMEKPQAVAGAVKSSGNESGRLEDRLTSALERGSFGAFFLVFLAGILVSFTPCVYPMIPIIIGFVGAGAGGSRAKGFFLSIFFVVGLAITYAILGVVAGATGALFGAFMSNPIVLIFIVLIFIALGASMLGAFDIALPASVQGRLMAGQRQGVIGAIIMGGVTGIVAAPCAGPPLLVLLGWIGNTGNLLLGFFLMATFAVGIGVLFIVIGTFAGAMTALPAAGGWMDTIKKGLGVVIFAVAVYYIGLLVPEAIYTMIVGGFLLMVGTFLGAFAGWDNLSGAKKYGKGVGLLLVLAGAFYFLIGIAEQKGVSFAGVAGGPSGSGEIAAVDESHVAWQINNHDEVLAQAAKEGKPILIDFYADWCGVCVELDHKVWNKEIVIDKSKELIALKLDYTRSTPELEALRKQYGVGGLPTVMILGPDGEERARFTSFMGPEEVVDWLQSHM